MIKIIKKIWKIIVLQVVSFVLLVWMVAFAAISWPSSTPDWGIVWWKFIQNFDNIEWTCPDWKVLNWFNADFTKKCVD